MIFVKRRVSSFAPTDIANCGGWWDASDTASITASGGAVSQWNDKSGNARHFTQGTGTNQPTTGTRTQNSLNVLDFDGSNDFMSAGDVLDVGTGGLTVFVVAAYDVTGNGGLLSKSRAGVEGGRWGFVRDSGTMLAIFEDTANRQVSKADTSTSARIVAQRVVRSGGNNQLYFGSTSQGTVATSGATNYNTTNVLLVGSYNDTAGTGPLAGYYLNGWVGEVIVYTTNLADADMTTVFNYLSAKWSV